MFSLFTSCWLESNEAVDLIRLNLIQISNRAKRDYYQLDSLLLCREITFEFVWRRYLYPGGKVLPFAGNFCLLCTIYHLTTTPFERVEISQKYQINYLIAAIKLFKFWSREWHSSQRVKKIRTSKSSRRQFSAAKNIFFVVVTIDHVTQKKAKFLAKTTEFLLLKQVSASVKWRLLLSMTNTFGRIRIWT